jgi:hypothetical protein
MKHGPRERRRGRRDKDRDLDLDLDVVSQLLAYNTSKQYFARYEIVRMQKMGCVSVLIVWLCI